MNIDQQLAQWELEGLQQRHPVGQRVRQGQRVGQIIDHSVTESPSTLKPQTVVHIRWTGGKEAKIKGSGFESYVEVLDGGEPSPVAPGSVAMTPAQSGVAASVNGAALTPKTIPTEEVDTLRGTSWDTIDLRAIAEGLRDGTFKRHQPEVGRRADGQALFYKGKVNGLAGDSNAGKTWTALLACAQEMEDGEHVVYLDWEDDEVGAVGRLLDLGVDLEVIVERFHYIRPEESSHGIEARARLEAHLAKWAPSLVVIDSTGEAMALDGRSPMDDDDTALWFRLLPSRIAKTGPAVVILDHMTKASEGKGLWPTGSQRKRAAVNGAQYTQQSVNSFNKETTGWSKIVCAKDRHGNYAQSEVVAGLWFDPKGTPRFTLRNPAGASIDPDQRMGGGAWRPTALMERASLAVEQADKPMTTNDLLNALGVNRNNGTKAVKALADEGFVERQDGPRNSHLHKSLRPYRQKDDPRSDVFEGAP